MMPSRFMRYKLYTILIGLLVISLPCWSMEEELQETPLKTPKPKEQEIEQLEKKREKAEKKTQLSLEKQLQESTAARKKKFIEEGGDTGEESEKQQPTTIKQEKPPKVRVNQEKWVESIQGGDGEQEPQLKLEEVEEEESLQSEKQKLKISQEKQKLQTPTFNGIKNIAGTYSQIRRTIPTKKSVWDLIFPPQKYALKDSLSLANGAILWETGWIQNVFDFGDEFVNEAEKQPDATVALIRMLFGYDDNDNSFTPNCSIDDQEKGPIYLAQALNAVRIMRTKLPEIKKYLKRPYYDACVFNYLVEPGKRSNLEDRLRLNKNFKHDLAQHIKIFDTACTVLQESVEDVSGRNINKNFLIQSLLQSEEGGLTRYTPHMTEGILLAYTYRLLADNRAAVVKLYKQLDILTGTSLLTAQMIEGPSASAAAGKFQGLSLEGKSDQQVTLYKTDTRAGSVSGLGANGPALFVTDLSHLEARAIHDMSSDEAVTFLDKTFHEKHLPSTTNPLISKYEKIIYAMTKVNHYPTPNKHAWVRYMSRPKASSQQKEKGKEEASESSEGKSVLIEEDPSVCDDMENAIRNVIRILSYDIKKGACIPEVIERRINKKIPEELTTFLKSYPDPDKDDLPQAHEEWFALCANIPKVAYGRKLEGKNITEAKAGYIADIQDHDTYRVLPTVGNFINVMAYLLGLVEIPLEDLSKMPSKARESKEDALLRQLGGLIGCEQSKKIKQGAQSDRGLKKREPKQTEPNKPVLEERLPADTGIARPKPATRIALFMRFSDFTLRVDLPSHQHAKKAVEVICRPFLTPQMNDNMKQYPFLSLACTHLFNWSRISNILYLPSQPLIYTNLFALPLQDPHLVEQFVNVIVNPLTISRMSKNESNADWFRRNAQSLGFNIFKSVNAPTKTFTHGDVASIGWNVVERMPESLLKQELKGKLLPFIKDKKQNVYYKKLKQAKDDLKEKIRLRYALEEFFKATDDKASLGDLVRSPSRVVRHAAERIKKQIKAK